MTRQQVDREFRTLIKRDIERYQADYERLKNDALETEAWYHGEPVPFLYQPRFFTPKDIQCFKDIVRRSERIFKKVIERYETDPVYRQAFGFSPQLDELIRLPLKLSHPFPMARIDIFYRGVGDFTFCEVNTDGSSAMGEDRAISRLLMTSEAWQDFSKNYEMSRFPLFISWVQTLLTLYQEVHPGKLPFVVILDYLSPYRHDEFERFRKTFRDEGMGCEICEPQELDYRDGWLWLGEKRVDAVYRRLVTTDFMAHYDELGHLVEAMRAGNTLWFGPVKSQIVHNKMLFKVLSEERFMDMFSLEEIAFLQEHVPYTALLTAAEIERLDLVRQKDQWILKPADGYASRGVYAGQDMTPEAWRERLEQSLDAQSLIQRYADVPATIMVDFEADGGEREYRHITGIFAYAGRFQGFFSRGGQQNVISGFHDGRTLATILAKKR